MLLSWLAVLAWAGLIFFFSAQPSLSTNLGIIDFILRKMAHMAEFGILFILLWRAIRQHTGEREAAIVAAALLTLAYAGSDEYHQTFVSGRTGTPRDVAIDLAGIIIAVIAVIVWRRRNHERIASSQ